MNVVLPAPFGPISACRAPGANASDTSLFALNAPQRLESPRAQCGSASRGGSLRLAPAARAQRVESARMPPRANSTITIRKKPIQNCQ
jgi:hypothetical protein